MKHYTGRPRPVKAHCNGYTYGATYRASNVRPGLKQKAINACRRIGVFTWEAFLGVAFLAFLLFLASVFTLVFLVVVF